MLLSTVWLAKDAQILLMAIERTPLLDPMTMRTFLLFLYGTGARVHEAIGLCISDIDFRHSLVSLRQADGGQKRMLPMGRTLRNTLDLYLQSSAAQRGDADLVFVTCNGRQLRRNTLRYNFVRICSRARIHQEHGYSPTPGMHDLRPPSRCIVWRLGSDKAKTCGRSCPCSRAIWDMRS